MGFSQLLRFATDANGLEKILRLLQSIAQIIAFQSLNPHSVVFWMHLRKQFALGRRYFRFFKFLDCFKKAHDHFSKATEWEDLIFGVGKWSFLGAYTGLESLTILDAMGAWHSPWSEACMLEANKFWFYSLFLSIIWGGIGIIWPKKTRTLAEGAQNQRILMRRFVMDVLDIFVPGHVTRWIYTGPVFVGFASVVSTSLSSKDVWDGLR